MEEFWSSYENLFPLEQSVWEVSSEDTPPSTTNDNLRQSTSPDIFVSEGVSSEILEPPTYSGSSCLVANIVTPESSEKIINVGCRRRKNFIPHKSPAKYDPTFRGGRVFMNFVMENGVPRFVMRLNFQLDNKRLRFRRRFSRSLAFEKLQNQLKNCDGSPNVTLPINLSHEKHCASCKVKKTPLWRDAEDGTPLCNACGIRYKKYKIRCARCWHIPKKDESSPNCISCGSGFHFVTHKTANCK